MFFSFFLFFGEENESFLLEKFLQLKKCYWLLFLSRLPPVYTEILNRESKFL